MKETYRRSILYSIGVGVICGCTDQTAVNTSEPGNATTAVPESSTQTQPSSTPETPDVRSLAFSEAYTRPGEDFRVELTNVGVRRTIEYLENPELRAIAYDESHAFLFIAVQAAADAPPKSEYRLLGNGSALHPTDRLGGAFLSEIVMANDFEQPYDETDSGGTLAFLVPTGPIEYSNMQLEMDDGETIVRWEMPSDLIDETNKRPEISLETWEMPTSIEPDDPFFSSIHVRNDSNDSGVFHARIKPDHTDRAETIVEQEISPNTEEEIEIELVYPPNSFVTPPSQSNTITYSLTWLDDRYHREVTLSDHS